MEKQVSANGRRNLKTLTVCVSLALPFAAQAQSTESNTAAGTTAMPQVQVQAQKLADDVGSYTIGRTRTATPLDMSLRDTPQSVSVITQQRIEDQGLQTITDVVNNVTGVSVNQYETHRGAFTARGFEVTNLQIDNIPTTWNAAWSAGEVLGSLALYDRVEVVRGATGLMTGAGTPSAALNLVRKRAFSKKLGGRIEATVGRWDKRHVMADVSTPLNESGSIRGRFVGEYGEGDSWVQHLENKDRTFYATVEADIGRDGTLSAGFSRQKMSPRGPMWGGLPYRYTDGSVIPEDRSRTSGTPWTGFDNQYDNFFADYEHRFANGWNLRFTYTDATRDGDSRLLYQYGVPDRVTGLGLAPSPGSYVIQTKQKDFGIHASGPFTAFGREHQAAVGYLHAKTDFYANNRSVQFPGLPAGDAPPIGDFNNWNPASYPTPTWGAEARYQDSETTQQGLYGMARFSLTDQLKAIVGARVTKYERDGGGAWEAPYAIKHSSEVTPYAGLVFDLNDTYSLYASHTSIFEPQNRRGLANTILDPIEGKASEAGIKGEFFDRRVNASLAVFHLKQDNLAQVAGQIDRDGSGPQGLEDYYRPADGATSKGIELDVSGEIMSGLNASIGYSIFRAKEANGVDFNSIYPRKTLRAFATYRLPGAWSKLTVGGGVNWEGSSYTVDTAVGAGVDPRIEQGSFALVNLMARYDFTKQLSAQLNVSNATDRTHFAMFAGFNQITYGAPRNTTLTLRYRF
ncbi:TonB-dependent siderophore receptor [Massilia sp. HP4]|uniref:TonB-dependent siderophore receptor n=1 Tax=Massilia sp. HP4 TaxID=2562316 RepID=UPI0010C11240|nr:TonB-dependent siderophore receptor [Massilia sp. HP4]